VRRRRITVVWRRRRLNAGATFSPIAKAPCAATCGPERRVKAQGFVLVSPRWPRRGALLAARFHASTSQLRQYRTSVCSVARARCPCSRPQQSMVPANPPCPTRKAGTNFTRYPSLHPVVPVRPSFSASANQWRQFQRSISLRRRLRNECPSSGVSSLDLGRQLPLAAPFSCSAGGQL
jgi:hypothetical protein